jgi:two-component system alkaline phosphatase synthesis response regulator PhoP
VLNPLEALSAGKVLAVSTPEPPAGRWGHHNVLSSALRTFLLYWTSETPVNRILIVEASEDLQTLARELQAAGYTVSACPSGEAAPHLEEETCPDAIVINLTHQPSDAIARELLAGESLPDQVATVVLLSSEQVETFDATLAVDDFLIWPASTIEVVTRLRHALWRRTGVDSDNAVRCGDLVMDLGSYRVFVSGHPIDLTYKEYELLRFLATHPDKVFTRDTLLNRVWGYEFYGGARTVDVHIRRLRSKLEDVNHSFIETVRNVGYRFKATP